jgi:hypothetical protein
MGMYVMAIFFLSYTHIHLERGRGIGIQVEVKQFVSL